MLGRDVSISWVRNIPLSSQKTKDFRREIIWDFFSSIWDFFAIFCQASRYRARFQASSGHSDSANRPGYEAGIKQDEIENDAIRNRISDFDSTKNPINKLAMNNRWLLIESEFHFVHPVYKES